MKIVENLLFLQLTSTHVRSAPLEGSNDHADHAGSKLTAFYSTGKVLRDKGLRKLAVTGVSIPSTRTRIGIDVEKRAAAPATETGTIKRGHDQAAKEGTGEVQALPMPALRLLGTLSNATK